MPKAADRCLHQLFLLILMHMAKSSKKVKQKTDRILAGIASQNVGISKFCNLDISVYRRRKIGNCFG